MIGWRELAVNFVKFTENYDSFDCAEPWARKTLMEHARDRREHLYSIEQLERSETEDELWNAAQNQMVKFGWMHNYMRMYWAKKILEWSPDPAKGVRHVRHPQRPLLSRRQRPQWIRGDRLVDCGQVRSPLV